MKKLKPSIAITLLLSLLLTACGASELSQFKTIYVGSVNAFDAFDTAIAVNANISQSLKDQVHSFRLKLDPTKSVIQALTEFPPANRQELSDLIKQIIPLLTQIAGNSQAGTIITIAAASALAFFQTESDMLAVTGPPAGAAGAPVNPALRLPELKAKLADFQKAVKAIQ